MRLQVRGKDVLATTGGRRPDPDLPLIVFVHGAGNDRTAWQLQTRYFAHHGFTVAAPDLPGHGGSEGPPPETIEDHAGWIWEFVDALGRDRAHLVGHSMGSLIALEAAAQAKERALTASLLGPAAVMEVHPDLLAAARAGEHKAFELITGWTHSPAGQRGGNQTPGIWMAGATIRMMERNRAEVLAKDLAACAAYSGAEAAAKSVTAPVLFIMGQRDLMTRPRLAEPLREILQPETVVLPGTGHAMMTENPDGVIDAIADFLRRTAADGR